ncbi:MAG: indolepyruvate oxidoreductase subunit beta [Clostridiales bacterium]|nr:indolepyruvate oxidoreductase subunit beta [Clostridiales bacterium]
MKETKNILLVGVGGQGTILVSRLLTQGLIKAGYDVKMSEIHGMAQRGGSVSTQVRYGSKVHSPIIGRGQADIMVAFEKMEAVRYVEFLKPGALAVINDYEIVPMSVASGFADYPQGTIEAMEANFEVIRVDAAETAARLGNSKVMNVVLLGAMVRAVGLDDIDWEQVLREQLSPKILDLNLKAFNAYK